MSAYRLNEALAPRSVALFGASDREGALGEAILRNLLASGFEGDIWPVNPKHSHLFGRRCYGKTGDLPSAPDLAVVATPPHTIAAIVESLATRGTRAAIVITAGLGEAEEKIAACARRHGMRLFGPNCLGIIVPSIGLNASFAHLMPKRGHLGFISQSGAILTSAIDWAGPRNIGFSHLLSLGNAIDVDIADMLDYLAEDRETRAILIYMEAIGDAAAFMSAARHAARAKPVIAMKVGRDRKAAKAVMSHTGALAGADDVYAAAFARAGVVRVDTLEELFDIGELLTHQRAMTGSRIGAITNGGGLGIIAADAISRTSLALADLSPETLATLDAALPANWSRGNPVDLIGDGGEERYKTALKALLEDENTDAVLVLNCPTMASSNYAIAEAVIEELRLWKETRLCCKPVLTSWVGDETAAPARRLFEAAGIATFETPEDAVNALRHLHDYARLQEAILRKPAETARADETEQAVVAEIMENALNCGRTVLFEEEAKRILAAYGVPVVPEHFARTPDEATAAAREILAQGRFHACVVKIVSRDITHKSDSCGVRLALESPEAAGDAAREMMRHLAAAFPEARLEGFSVQPMIAFAHSRELIAGIVSDDTFGPVVMTGSGGTAVEILNDKAIGLPPLRDTYARDMIARTAISRRLKAYRNVPAADTKGVEKVLLALSRLACDQPLIRELDINPLIAHPGGVIALDARIGLAADRNRAAAPYDHLAIMPYPKDLAEDCTTQSGIVFHVRPIVPEDEDLYGAFFERLTGDDIFARFFSRRKEFDHTFIAKLAQIDYRRDMAFVAIEAGRGALAGVARLAATRQPGISEFAVIVRSDLKGQGIGWLLMEKLLEFARGRALRAVVGDILADNTTMIQMCRELGFSVERLPEDAGIYHATLDLDAMAGRGRMPGR